MKIAIGLSGGVDSSVSAYILKQQGFEVIGIFMKNWEEDDTDAYCPAAEDRQDAEQVADKLGIPFYAINFAAEYWERVFQYFLQEYQAGRTPNPDILCNKEIKFKAFLNYAKHLGCDKIATGHYAQLRERDGVSQLLRAEDANKDQTYFLYTLQQAQLRASVFPVGHLLKPEVRKIAEAEGFTNAKKKDSTGICFIGERKFKEFLARYLPAQPGLIVTPEHKVLGEHQGLMYYTIGQRQGIGIGGVKGALHSPWFVAQKDLKSNYLVVVEGHDHPLLYQNHLRAKDLHWVQGQAPGAVFNCTAKTRYRQKDAACEVSVQNDEINVQFAEPQWAITPGQSIVLYQNEICLGGGVII
jgi:tRNA-uridine 2-sulfurtransferase